jgi:WD40 repeat protein
VGDDSVDESRTLYAAEGTWDTALGPEVAPDGSFVAFGTFNGSVWVIPLEGESAPEHRSVADVVTDVAVDAESRLVAGGGGAIDRSQAIVRVWNLETGEIRSLDAGDGAAIGFVDFTSGGDLLVDSGSHLRRWDLSGPEPRVVDAVDLGGLEHISFAYQGQLAGGDEILFVREGRLLIHDFRDKSLRELSSHGRHVFRAALDAAGQIVVSSDRKGVIRVGPLTGAEPHLLFGHQGLVQGLAVSADGRWIASCGEDETVRLWPIPDLSKPPLHTLPREDLIAKLKTMTNLRAVRGQESPAGWILEIGPFQGWEAIPTW